MYTQRRCDVAAHVRAVLSSLPVRAVAIARQEDPVFRRLSRRWVCAAAGVAAGALSGHAALESRIGAPQRGRELSTLLRSLPKVTELPSGFRPVGELAGRGQFYSSNGAVARLADGSAHHTGSATTAAWAALAAKGVKGHGTQGVLYRVEDGAVTAAGYLIRQADLVGGRSFRGLTLRGLPLPAAHSLSIDLIKGATPEANLYLWLWHFLAERGPAPPMLPIGELQSLTIFPGRFVVIGADAHPKGFYPRMGRHHRDGSHAGRRLANSVGDDSVTYGEAAGKLIFIEYIFGHDDFAAGVTWPAMPLNSVPLPPIDNVHIMHYEATSAAAAYFTAHMYFIPEDTYLGWEREPPSVSAAR